MLKTSAVAALAAALALAVAAPASGQDRWPVSVEAVLGLGTGGSSGDYKDNATGPTADLLVGVRVASAGSGALFAAGTIGVQAGGPHDDGCFVLPDGRCRPAFPEFTLISVLGGWEKATTNLRFLTGPAVVRAYGDWDTYRFAWIGRADAAAPLGGPISALASLRTTLVPSYDGDTFLLVSLGVGLRVR